MSSVGKIALILTALALAGCGVRGSLEAPPQAQAEGEATSPDARGTAEASAGPDKPHRGFILGRAVALRLMCGASAGYSRCCRD